MILINVQKLLNFLIFNTEAPSRMQSQSEQCIVKKYSKVSSALKCRLFHCIFIKKLSIKDSAKLCKLNYSTAKSIIKNISEKQEIYITNELNLHQLNLQHQKKHRKRSSKSCYKTIMVPDKPKTFNNSNHQPLFYIEAIEKNQDMTSKSTNHKPITVVSSIGYDFFNIQQQHKPLNQNVNFSNPFQSKKNISCIINLTQLQKNRNPNLLNTVVEIERVACQRKLDNQVSN